MKIFLAIMAAFKVVKSLDTVMFTELSMITLQDLHLKGDSYIYLS